MAEAANSENRLPLDPARRNNFHIIFNLLTKGRSQDFFNLRISCKFWHCVLSPLPYVRVSDFGKEWKAQIKCASVVGLPISLDMLTLEDVASELGTRSLSVISEQNLFPIDNFFVIFSV